MTILIIALIAAYFGLYAFAVRENAKPQPKISWKITANTTVTPHQK